jgi:hypothetical protein
MRQQLCAGAIALVFFGSINLSDAQSDQNANQSTGQNAMPSQGSASGNASLSPTQGRSITQGLSAERPQSAPSGFDAQVGTKLPDSMAPKSLPSDVTAQVPQAQGYLFVKMPDRVLLIDPDSKTVVEIVPGQSGSTSN